MHGTRKIKDDLIYVGGGGSPPEPVWKNLFPIPRGVSYNSYVLLDPKKTVLFDTADDSIGRLFCET